MADNTVTLVGNLTRDLELRFSNSGTPIASSGLAINNRRKQPDGSYEDDTPHFFDLQIFGSLAENAAETLTKGTRVVVTGRLDYQQWDDKEGNHRSRVLVLADAIGPDLRWATAQVAKTEKR